jgi:hypothetical protein
MESLGKLGFFAGALRCFLHDWGLRPQQSQTGVWPSDEPGDAGTEPKPTVAEKTLTRC